MHHHPLPPPWDKALFLVFPFKICLPHQSVMPFLSGAAPPKKNLGPTPVTGYDKDVSLLV